MIGHAKTFAKRWWPALPLRAILLTVLLLAAALPGFSAVFLRVYENTLVRQTQAELIAQGATLAASAAAMWPGAPPGQEYWVDLGDFYRPEPLTIDLRTSPLLPERPAARLARQRPDGDALLAARRLAPVIIGTSRVTLASIKLLDRHGIVVMGYQDGGASYAHIPEVRAALAGRSTTVLRRNGDYAPRYSFEWLSRASGLRVHHARPVMVGDKVVGALLLARSPRGLFLGIYQDRGKIALGVGLILLLLIGTAGVLSRAIARPIEALSLATEQVARGPVAIPDTPATAAIEIRALYENFRVMAARIERRSRYLRDFAAAVSHEFKTPIAGIKGALELLDEHGAGMSAAERARFIANAAADADRLSHLVQRLLDLARADMAVAREDVATLLDGPVLRVADAQRGPALAIDVTLPPDPPRIAVPAEAIEAALDTLIENSRHAGATRITIQAAIEGEHVRLALADNGHGVPTGDQDRLFEPFFTSRRAQGGTGLGLAIIRSLFAASGAGIAYRPGAGGACFELMLPLAPPQPIG